jgi:hypothetical protein
MSEKSEHQHDELTEEEVEETDGAPLPDREAMSLITPLVDKPGFTVPIDPQD